MAHTTRITQTGMVLLLTGVMLFAGLTGTKPASVDAAVPLAPTDEPLPPPVAGGDPLPPSAPSPAETEAAPVSASQSAPRWDGDPSSPNYDGRINATMADRYAVYCLAGEFQVWDGVENNKVAAVPLSQVATMPSNTTLQIGEGVILGRGGHVLVVVGPGDFSKTGIDFEDCTGSL